MISQKKTQETGPIKAIIGLGNPGPAHYRNRHSIGFRVLDAIAEKYNLSWRERPDMEIAEFALNNNNIVLIKPQTYMNASGRVIPFLLKRGIKPEHILVIHDEIELPFGSAAYKYGGSARGHNGLRSIIAACGDQFHRIRCGVGRPERKEDVPAYVLQNFSESADHVQNLIDDAVLLLEDKIQSE